MIGQRQLSDILSQTESMPTHNILGCIGVLDPQDNTSSFYKRLNYLIGVLSSGDVIPYTPFIPKQLEGFKI